jgi:hypothetical protein
MAVHLVTRAAVTSKFLDLHGRDFIVSVETVVSG